MVFEELKHQTLNKIQELPGKVGFYLSFPETGERFEYHAEEVIYPASVIKIALLVEFFHQVSTGQIDSQRRVKVTGDNRVQGSGVIKLMDPDDEYTLKDLATLMIAHSDNCATNQLVDILTVDSINNAFQRLGMTHSVFKHKMMINAGNGPNESSAKEIGKLLEKIYRHEVDQADEILRIMNEVVIRDRIPRDLPKDIVVAHKTGDAEGLVHDAGIVYAQNPFIVVFLAEDQVNREQTKETIAHISQLCFDFAHHPTNHI